MYLSHFYHSPVIIIAAVAICEKTSAAYILFFFKPFPKQALDFMCLQLKSVENTGQRESKEQFFLFPQCFLLFCKTFHQFHQIQNFCLHPFSVRKSLKFVIRERVRIFSLSMLTAVCPILSPNSV